jgi:hypothetical protein
VLLSWTTTGTTTETGANIEMTTFSGVPIQFWSTGVAEETTSANIQAIVENPGASEFISWFLVGPRIVTHTPYVFIIMSGPAKDGSAATSGSLQYNDGTSNHTMLSWSPAGVFVSCLFPGDGNTYQVDEFRQTLAADVLINSVGFTQIFGGWSLGVGTYIFDGYLKVLPNVNGGAVKLLLAAAGAVATLQVEVVETIEGTPGSFGNVAALAAFGASFTGSAFNAGIGRTIQMHGTLVVTTAGAVAFEVATSVAADTYTVQHLGSYLLLKPYQG